MESDYNNTVAMDIQNLISCIHWHEGSNNEQVVLETLKTITDICTNESCGRDALREESGLDFLVEFMFTTDNAIFLEHSLRTLACVIDENIHNQMYMTKKSVFEVIQTILRNQKFPVVTRKNAIVLISAILYQNSSAQSLLSEVGLFQDLLNTYEQGAERLLTGSSYAPASTDPLNELWINSNSALCFAVNNPQHSTNQEICSTIFSISVRILELSSNADIISSVSSLLSLCISNNRYCQNKFAEHDGLLICKRFFQRHFDSVQADIKDCNNVIGKGALQMLDNIIGIISAATSENEKNAVLLGKLGVVSLMVKLLFVKPLDVSLKTKIVLSLGHSIDAHRSNKFYVLDFENIDNLLKENLRIENEELSSACKYLLQVCLMEDGASEQEENISIPYNSMRFEFESERSKQGSKSKNKSPEMNKISNPIEERSNRKRPGSCLSISDSSHKQTKRHQAYIADAVQGKQTDFNCEYSFSCLGKDKNVLTEKKDILNSSFASHKDFKNTIKGSALSKKSLNTPSEALIASSAKCEESDSSSDSSSLYYPAEDLLDLLKEMESNNQSEMELNKPLSLSPFIHSSNKKATQNATPKKKTPQAILPILHSRDENKCSTPLKTKRQMLTDRTNFNTPDIQTSQKKFKFDPVFLTPLKTVPVISNKQETSFTSSQICDKLGGNFKRSSRTRFDTGRQSSEACSSSSKNSVKSPQLSCKRRSSGSPGEKAKRTRGRLSPSTSGSYGSPIDLNDSYSSKCVQVIVIPGEKCEEHNLISSFESLQVVPLDEAHRT